MVLIRIFCLFVFVALLGARAAEAEVPVRDTLVYKDGDRLQGRVISTSKDFIVFQSDRFGQLTVATSQAVVIKAEVTVPAPVATTPTKPAAPVETVSPKSERAEHERIFRWENFSPALVTAKVREFFGPWHGRLAVSTEVVSDTAERGNLSIESQLKRKWTADEVQLNARYDFSQTSEITTTDMVKLDGSWRHDFPSNRFLQYRPALEWNRASFTADKLTPNDYLLVQQEIGVGLSLLNKPTRKVRAGVSENLFNTWTQSPPKSSTSRTVESVFLESELKLPGGLLLTDRGVYYYSLTSRADGWENRIDLTKKFTETLSTAIRHDTRQGSPDGKAQDYTRLKLLIGLDF